MRSVKKNGAMREFPVIETYGILFESDEYNKQSTPQSRMISKIGSVKHFV
jgi:hypothetical protein